jgi:hypothetical protein
MSEFDRTGNFRRSIRRPRAPKPPENQTQNSSANAEKNNKLRNYSAVQQNETQTKVTNNSNNNNKPTTTNIGGDSSNFDFNVIQNYINKLEFNVLMKKKSNERLNQDEMLTTPKFNNKDSIDTSFVRGGANRTSIQNHSTANYDKEVTKKPLLRTRSDTDKVEVVRKQMLLKSAHQNVLSDVSSVLKQVKFIVP